MMASLHAPSLLLVVGLLYALLSLCVWLMLGCPQRGSARLWCLGKVLAGFAVLLIALRGQIPDPLSYVLGQPLLVLGALLVAQSLRIDLGRPWRWSVLLGAMLVFTGFLAIMLPWSEQLPAYTAVIISVNLAVVVLLVHSAWQVSRAEKSRSALTLVLAYGVQALAVAVNLVLVLQLPEGSPLLENTPLGAARGLLMLIVAPASLVAYVGLMPERALGRQRASVRALARQQGWQAQYEALAAFDRERLMSVLADSLRQTMTQPLTAAALNLQAARCCLHSAPPDGVRLQQLLARMRSDLQRTVDTIGRLRNWLRPARAGVTSVDMVSLVHEVEQLLGPEAERHRVRVSWQCPPQAVPVLGDGLELSQAVVQIVRNAMQAALTHPQPEVEVMLHVENSTVCLQVRDNGPGLSQALLTAMAQPQGHVPEGLQTLGLFIVQSIVRQHQGTLALHNPADGGACVRMCLPLYGGPG